MIEYYPVRLERLNREKWDGLVEISGTVFHHSEWLLLWESSFPFESSVYLAVDGDDYVGGIPFCHREKFRFKEAYSMPRGCYGGAVMEEGNDPEIRRQLESEFAYWCMREEFTRINLIEFSPEVNTNLDSFAVRPMATHVLNLKYSSDEQLNRLANSHKRNLPKAFEKEFSLEIVESADGVKVYFGLIEATARRQEREPYYRLDFYNELFNVFHESPRLYWPRIMCEGKMIASGIFFIHRDTTIYWDGAASEEALDKGANFFLFWNVIQLMKDKGIEILDFGASPKHRPGLKRFKSGWGAERLGYFEYNYQKPLSRIAGKIKGFF